MAKKATKKARKPRKKPEPMVATTHVPDRCPKCGSTDREEYNNVVTKKMVGTHPVEHTSISWKRTCCRSCGQGRCVKIYNFDPKI